MVFTVVQLGLGGMPEWSKGELSKSSVLLCRTGGSNPSPSVFSHKIIHIN